jgi:tRNA A-37 threonylcarbamoyl transferase component Bud32
MGERVRKLLSLGYSGLLRWLWLLRNYRRLQDDLRRDHGVSKVRPILAQRWHRGSKYFRGEAADGTPLFIKLDGDSRLLENEVNAWAHLDRTAAGSNHFPKMRFFNFMGQYRVAAMEWLDGETLRGFLMKNPPVEQIRCLMRELAAILGELSRAGMVHRDFTPDNLMVSARPSNDFVSLVLIDFAFASISGAAPQDRLVPLIDLRDLCDGYKAEEYQWDDAYSCLKIFEEIAESFSVEDQAAQAEVTNRIGDLTFSFDILAAERERVWCFATRPTPNA